VKLRVVFFIIIACVAWAEEPPRRRVFASLSIGEEALSLAFRFRGLAAAAGAGLSLSVPRMAMGASFAEFENDACAVYVGIGRFLEGRALRNLPGSQPRGNVATLWSQASESGEALSVFGMATAGLRFVVLADPSSESDDAILGGFRLCGIEGGTRFGDRCAVDGGLSLAAVPGKDSGDGWRRGAACQPASSVLSAAIAARYIGDPIEADSWFSCEAGSLAEPGAAMSLRLAATRSAGFFAGASLGIFVASGRFRTLFAESPTRDFSADIKARFVAGPWRFSLGATAASFGGKNSGARVVAKDVSTFERLLWQWRADMVALSIEACFREFSLRTRGSADSAGPKDALVALCLAPPGRDLRRVGLSGSVTARFAKTSSSSSDEEDEDNGWDDEDDEYAGVETGLADFTLRSLRGEGCLRWNPPANLLSGAGNAKLSLSARHGEESWAFTLSGSLSQTFTFPYAIEITIGLRTPTGGLVLGKIPEDLPRLSLDCGFPLGWRP